MTPRLARRACGKLAFVGFLGLAGSCDSTQFPEPRRPASAPRIFDGLDFIPRDLDVVVRLDLEQIRLALGAHVLNQLRAQSTFGSTTPGALDSALDTARTAWLGFRPAASTELLDSVLVFSGRFARRELHTEAPKTWAPAEDLGGLLRRYQRLGAVRRAEPARAYLRGDDLLAFVSAVEIDSVERVLAQGADPDRLQPVARGLVSFALRPRALPMSLHQRAPKLAERLGRARRIRGAVDAEGDWLEAVVEIDFSSEVEAAEAVALSRELLVVAKELYPKLAQFIASAELDAQGPVLVLKARLRTVGIR
ncbi:MAG: hypothetical protein SFV15_06535 [Polyangiaceae bacterium]|nr:hypothetical protein [Polyangiaceae bacterium]